MQEDLTILSLFFNKHLYSTNLFDFWPQQITRQSFVYQSIKDTVKSQIGYLCEVYSKSWENKNINIYV